MAQRNTSTRQDIDVQHFPLGVNSYVEPQLLPDTMVRWAVNAVCKGGIWQTRPGFRTALDFTVEPYSQAQRWLAANPVYADAFATLLLTENVATDYYAITTYRSESEIREIGDYPEPRSPGELYASEHPEVLEAYIADEGEILDQPASLEQFAWKHYNDVGIDLGYQWPVSPFPPERATNFAGWWIRAGRPKIHPQFCTIFAPTDDAPYLVYGVSGAVFAAKAEGNGDFGPPIHLEGLKFDPQAVQIVATETVKSADIVNGLVVTQVPQKYLIIQDGVSRAGFWNGIAHGHLNPEKYFTTDANGNTLYAAGWNQTRIGLWQAWSGNRLWVANGNQVYASNPNDPINFTDEIPLVSVPVFNFDSDVTGMSDRGTSGTMESILIVMTQNSVYTLRSGVANRVTQYTTDGQIQQPGWFQVQDFQRKIFNGIGCVAGKSILNHYGLFYWYSKDGVVRFDSTGTVYSSQNLPPMDDEMSISKQRMSPNKATVCAGSAGSYVFWSVPSGTTLNGRAYNPQTQVYDTNVIPTNVGVKAWQGVWTGIRPVEWVTEVIYGRERTFAFSMDADGVPRVWEAFQGNRSDNGYPITWSVETKSHPVTQTNFDRSVFRFARLKLIEVYGQLCATVWWKGSRGNYHQILNTSVEATPGSIFSGIPGSENIVNDTLFETYRKQVRVLTSEVNRGDLGENNSADVEDPRSDDVDSLFSLRMEFCGVGALLAYRIAVDAQADNTEGLVMEPETGNNVLPGSGDPKHYPPTT